MQDLKNYIDHTLLAATATESQIRNLCEEAKEHEFFAICVNSSYVALAREVLKDSKVKLASTIGFPLGAASASSKIQEAKKAILEGAEEIDMVINIGFFKDGKYDEVQSEILELKEAIGNNLLKVIIETCYLSDTEIEKASELVIQGGADYVKTSTGFGTRGASLNDIKIMKKVVGDKIKIKASGVIRDAETARQYIQLGVSRIGTSSGIKIISNK